MRIIKCYFNLQESRAIDDWYLQPGGRCSFWQNEYDLIQQFIAKTIAKHATETAEEQQA